MLGSVGGVFSASEFGILEFEVGLCLEENDLGRKFLRDVEEMVPEKRVSEVCVLLNCLMVKGFAEQVDKLVMDLYTTERRKER